MDAEYIPLSRSSSFVGGAEQARRNARKRMHQPRRPSNANHRSSKRKRRSNGVGSIAPYPKSMREYERFFGSLLSSSPEEMKLSETHGGAHEKVMHRACSLLNVPSLPTPMHLQQRNASLGGSRGQFAMRRSSSCLSSASYSSAASSSPGTYDNARSYYMSKAPLILEESRCSIAGCLTKNTRSHRGSGDSFTLELMSIEEKYPKVAERQPQYAPLIMNFHMVNEPSKKKQQHRSSERSARWTRPGSVLLLRQQRQNNDRPEPTVLACIVPNGNWQSSDNSSLSLMIFRRDGVDLAQSPANDDEEKLIFSAMALTTLISHVRQMEACLRMVKVAFMPKLLGQKNPTHIRFGDSSDEDSEEEVVGSVEVDGGEKALQEGFYVDDGSSSTGEEDDEDDECGDWSLAGLLSKIPSLNPTQERAAKKFLESPKESLILVQGPPGTGKSTFLVNVICRRLAANPNARLLVTAPTNKAVTVLAERFLDCVRRGDEDLSDKCNAVLVGVEDQLISNEAEYISTEALSSSLRDIFVYTWVESLKNECESLLVSLKNLHGNQAAASIDTLASRAASVKTKICSGIPSERSACNCSKLLAKQLQEFSACESWEGSVDLESAVGHAQDLVDTLDDVESPVQELLATARIIFCTLATAGSSILKQTRRIDDLLIDEAAAATEPELCIPFHLRPQRLLAVGDPLQLPPTIISQHAADMGLSTSMHQRLMNQCGDNDHIMLDHQYRMHPHISSFPNKIFYGGQILDGKNVSCKTYRSDAGLPMKSPYSFINVRGEEYQIQHGGSYANDQECAVVLKLVERLAASKKVPDWHSPDKLRIITFYSGQVSLLRQMLCRKGFGKVLVATVDSSQGCEADVVIISFVRSSSNKGPGFLADDRRINVALTRARHSLVCIGDADGTLSRQADSTLGSLVSNARTRGCLIEA